LLEANHLMKSAKAVELAHDNISILHIENI